MPEPRDLQDAVAERCVLAGLMRGPDETVALLRTMRFDRSAFYDDSHMRLYDVLVYVYLGGAPEGMLVGAYDELRRREPGWLKPAAWLVDVWETNWFADIQKWATFDHPDEGQAAWVAAAATRKVLHLQARRHALTAARELMRDALDPHGGADEIEDRIDDTF
jgi:hypothetical protein